jgi:N-acetylneuraminate synthase
VTAPPRIHIGDRHVGIDCPTYVVCEGGVNHNGDFAIAIRLVDAAADCGADAIKWQRRTPELHASATRLRESCTAEPGVLVTELEHRTRMEFTTAQYRELTWRASPALHCFASAWDAPSVDWLAAFHPPAWKIASASITDLALMEHTRDTARADDAAIIMSTGMSTIEEVDAAVDVLGKEQLAILHCVSDYPAETSTLNLRCLATLRERYGVPVGYSGHEHGIAMSTCAVALGACIVERHLTLDRTMRGSDHAASLEPHGFATMVRDIRALGFAMGDGVKRITASEEKQRERLRRVA